MVLLYHNETVFELSHAGVLHLLTRNTKRSQIQKKLWSNGQSFLRCLQASILSVMLQFDISKTLFAEASGL